MDAANRSLQTARMKRPSEEYATAAKAVTALEAEMARQLLADAGLPCLVHGPDFDRAELGASHGMVRRVDVLVAPADADKARAVLDQAWGPDRKA
jgi:hypothetical protein